MPMARRVTPKGAVAVLALACTAALAPVALATSTHQEYVAKVNPICKDAARDAKRIPSRVRPTGRPLVDFLRRTSAYANLLSKALKRIAAVEPAPGEATRVKAWLSSGRRTVRLIRRFVRLSSSGDFGAAKELIRKIVRSQRIGQKRAARLGLPACSRDSQPT
jgi:hypothetical protein